MKGLLGAIVATLGMILPSTIIIYIVSIFFGDLLSNSIISNVFKGIRVAVCILIVQAAIKMIKKVMKNSKKKLLPSIIISSFFLIVLISNFLGTHFSTIYLILVSGFIGYFVYGKKPNKNMGGTK